MPININYSEHYLSTVSMMNNNCQQWEWWAVVINSVEEDEMNESSKAPMELNGMKGNR